jgi:hypothetical protein
MVVAERLTVSRALDLRIRPISVGFALFSGIARPARIGLCNLR